MSKCEDRCTPLHGPLAGVTFSCQKEEGHRGYHLAVLEFRDHGTELRIEITWERVRDRR